MKIELTNKQVELLQNLVDNGVEQAEEYYKFAEVDGASEQEALTELIELRKVQIALTRYLGGSVQELEQALTAEEAQL